MVDMHGMVVEWSLAQALAPGTQLGCLVIRDKRLDNAVLMGQSKWHTHTKQNQNEYFTLTSKLSSFRTPCLPGQIHYVPIWASSGYSSVDEWPYNSPFSDRREIPCNTSKLLFFTTQITGHAPKNNHRIFPEGMLTIWEMYLLLLLLLLSLCPWPRHLTSGRSRGSVPIISTLWIKASKMTNIKQTKEQLETFLCTSRQDVDRNLVSPRNVPLSVTLRWAERCTLCSNCLWKGLDPPLLTSSRPKKEKKEKILILLYLSTLLQIIHFNHKAQ